MFSYKQSTWADREGKENVLKIMIKYEPADIIKAVAKTLLLI